MAAASASAAATSATADDANPLKAEVSPPDVPNISTGFSGSGEKPTANAMSTRIMTALIGYGTASVIHMMTANTKMPMARCPATETPSNGGRNMMSSIAANAIPIHIKGRY